MAIETHKDPKTRKEYLLAVGKVDGIFINELKEVKTYSGPNGPWTPTHSVNLVVDGTRISLGLTDKESVRAKDVNDEYQDVERGAEVSVVVEENGEYKGVTQYRSRSSQITVLEVAPKKEQKSTGNQPAFKRDNTGVETGHALNGALNLVRGGLVDNDNEAIALAAEVVHNVTTALKKEYAEKNPKMSEYDVGAMVGNAVLNATRDIDAVEFLEGSARFLLDEVVPLVSQSVKASKEVKEEKTVAEKAKPAAKKVVKKSAPKEETQPEPDLNNFDDQDIPF